jgi:hypothetical protein
MARKVDGFPEPTPRSVYPWSEWLDGGIWELTPGKDFKGKPAAFRANAIAQAKRRDGRARTRRVKDPEGKERFYIQFLSA